MRRCTVWAADDVVALVGAIPELALIPPFEVQELWREFSDEACASWLFVRTTGSDEDTYYFRRFRSWLEITDEDREALRERNEDDDV